MYGIWFLVQWKQKDTRFSIPSLSVHFPSRIEKHNPPKMHEKIKNFKFSRLILNKCPKTLPKMPSNSNLGFRKAKRHTTWPTWGHLDQALLLVKIKWKNYEICFYFTTFEVEYIRWVSIFTPICVFMIWPDFFAQVAMLEHTSWQNFALILYGLSLIAEVRSALFR